jgi:hypothetical protein
LVIACTEGLEVVGPGLVDEDVAVGQEQDALLELSLPQPPDDLEGGVGLAGAGGHDQQDAILATGDGLDGAIDRGDLVVTGNPAGTIVVIRSFHGGDRIPSQTFPGAVALPEFGRRRKFGQLQLGFRGESIAGTVMEEEAVAIAGEHEGDVERFGVVEALLHASAEAMHLILGFDQGNRLVGFVVQHIVSAFAFTPAMQLATHDDATFCEADFFANLGLQVPACRHQGRGNVFAANVAFGELGHGRLF